MEFELIYDIAVYAFFDSFRTRGRVLTMIAGVWIMSMVVSLPPLVGWKRPQPVKDGFPLCVLSEEPGYVIYSTVGSFYVPLTVIVVVYSKIYAAARRRARRNLTAAAAASRGQQNSRPSRRRMMQSVSQSTMASNLSNPLRTEPSKFEGTAPSVAAVQHWAPAAVQASTVDGRVAHLTPTVVDAGRISSEAATSHSDPDDAGVEPDIRPEQDDDEEELSDAELDSDNEETVPHVVFTTSSIPSVQPNGILKSTTTYNKVLQPINNYQTILVPTYLLKHYQ